MSNYDAIIIGSGAGVVISNADPEVTFGQLIGKEKLSPRLKRKVDSVKYSTSCLSLFFATDMDLRRTAGLDSGNFWFYENEDVDKIYSDGLTDALLREETPPGMFLTATTLKDPSKLHSGHHTCESFAFVGYEAFEQWARTKYGSRPADYDAMKEDLAWRKAPTESTSGWWYARTGEAHPWLEQAHRILQSRHAADE